MKPVVNSAIFFKFTISSGERRISEPSTVRSPRFILPLSKVIGRYDPPSIPDKTERSQVVCVERESPRVELRAETLLPEQHLGSVIRVERLGGPKGLEDREDRLVV